MAAALYGIILLATFLILTYIYFTRRYTYWKKRNVYYIKPTLLFGNLLPFFSMKQTLGEWLRHLSYNNKRDYFGIFLFSQPVLVVKSPKIIRGILQKDFSYFSNRAISGNDFHDILSNLLVLAKNPKWKELRTKANPVFSSGKLKAMFHLILNESNSMIDYISEQANIPNVEAKEICAKYSTNVIARCAFAVDAQCFKDNDAEFRQLGRRVFDVGLSNALRQFLSWLAPGFVSLLKLGLIDEETITRFAVVFNEVLNARKGSTLKGNDLVDILLDVKKENEYAGLSANAMLGLAIQIFIAGFETVSSTLGFALYEICIHPDIQEKLRREIIENIKKHQGITYEGLQEMQYLDMCVSEALRKYPVLPFLDRVCNQNYKVEGTDLVIEKGIPVYIPLFGLHYDPEYYPEPEKFIPERFEDKSKINKDGLFYIPFGEGPRICIGNRFGLLGVKTGIVRVLSKFKLEVTDKTPIPVKFEPTNLILTSTVGLPMKFVPIQEN